MDDCYGYLDLNEDGTLTFLAHGDHEGPTIDIDLAKDVEPEQLRAKAQKLVDFMFEKDAPGWSGSSALDFPEEYGVSQGVLIAFLDLVDELAQARGIYEQVLG